MQQSIKSDVMIGYKSVVCVSFIRFYTVSKSLGLGAKELGAVNDMNGKTALPTF